MVRRDHQFGGDWTEKKLTKVRKYLPAYTTALKNTPFKLMYIDAFAGTGYRTSANDPSAIRQLLDFPEVDDLAKGSARLALEVDPAFDRYVFIEKSKPKLARLREMVAEYPHLSDRVEFELADANQAICDLCRETNWSRWRAVVFLDPYGTQVDWSTVEAIADSKSIDLWYLFPTGMGLDRMLTKSGKINPTWRKRLDRLLGTREWREVFYQAQDEPDLFSEERKSQHRTFDEDRAVKFILKRMDQIFAGVGRAALPLRNSKGTCMYHLVFACGNPRGKSVALRIAEHILKD
jgi:three-Cys-motif partner protein